MQTFLQSFCNDIWPKMADTRPADLIWYNVKSIWHCTLKIAIAAPFIIDVPIGTHYALMNDKANQLGWMSAIMYPMWNDGTLFTEYIPKDFAFQTYTNMLQSTRLTLTNIYLLCCFRPNSSLTTLNANSASMWVKAISSWFCLILYGWTLVAPIVLRDREFS